jgi:hypothetical protein
VFAKEMSRLRRGGGCGSGTFYLGVLCADVVVMVGTLCQGLWLGWLRIWYLVPRGVVRRCGVVRGWGGCGSGTLCLAVCGQLPDESVVCWGRTWMPNR